jgi:hypothetical protein
VIRYVQGDILDADAEALVNTVNSVGVMGRGIPPPANAGRYSQGGCSSSTRES